jgi:hypothetical protein
MRFISLNVRTLIKGGGVLLLPLLFASIVDAAPAPRPAAAGPLCDPQTPAHRKLPRHPKTFGGPLADRSSWSRLVLTDLTARMQRGMRADLASDEEIIQNDAPMAQIDGDDRPVPALRPLGILVNSKDVRPDSQASSPRSPRGPPVSA